MGHSWKNGSQLEKRVAIRKMGHLEKWVTVIKMVYI